MTDIQRQPIIGKSVWKAANFADNSGRDKNQDSIWCHHLTTAEIAACDAMLASLKSRGLAFPQIKQSDIAKPDIVTGALAELLDSLTDELENGLGFKLLRGLPIARYSDDDINTLFYAIGLYMGQPVCQNPKGDLLGNVMNVGDITRKDTRVYETSLYLPYHTDPSDVVGLLSVRKAKSGGMSSLVSAAAIYNAILERRPDLLDIYYQQFCYAHLGEDKTSPIFSFHHGKLSCRYLRQYIELGYEQMGVPVSPLVKEALDVFDEIMMSPDMRIDMMMEPGDMQFANNYMVLHSRTAFDDHDEKDLWRKKLRLWLKMENARLLAPEFPGRNGFGVPAYL